MKKHLFLLTFIIILITTPVVLAEEECDPKCISITSITKKDNNTNGEENKEASADNNSINVDVKLFDPGDTIEYTIEIENTSTEEVKLDENNLIVKNEYVQYEVLYDDDSNIIKPNEKKNLSLNIQYNNKVPYEKLQDGGMVLNGTLSIGLEKEGKQIINPDTGTGKLIIFISILTITGLLIILFNKKHTKKIVSIMIILTFIIPIISNAICKYKIEINANVEIDGREAIFLPGTLTNAHMKRLAGDTVTDDNGKTTANTTIKAIKQSEIEPTEEQKQGDHVVSIPESKYPIYMWFNTDDETMYWWSEDLHPELNTDPSYMFAMLSNLTDITGLEPIISTPATTLENTFDQLTSLKDLSPVANWNTSNVTSLSRTFRLDTSLEDISPLANWDTSNVTNMYGTFLGAPPNFMHIKSLKPLKNWDTSKVTTMSYMLQAHADLTNLEGLENWNTSSLKNLNGFLMSSYGLIENTALSNWDTSKVTNMDGVFHNCNNLRDASGVNNWDVSNVTTFSHMFNVANNAPNGKIYGEIRTIDLSKWNMPKALRYDWFMDSQYYISTEMTIVRKSAAYNGMFTGATTREGRIVVNYTAESEELVDKMIATRSSGSHVEKGRLIE